MVEHCTPIEHSFWDRLSGAIIDYGSDLVTDVIDDLKQTALKNGVSLLVSAACTATVNAAISVVASPQTAIAIAANPTAQARIGLACEAAAAGVAEVLID